MVVRDAKGKPIEPGDVVIADDFSAEANTHTVLAGNIREGWKGLDVGPITVERYSDVIAGAGTSGAGTVGALSWAGFFGALGSKPRSFSARSMVKAMS